MIHRVSVEFDFYILYLENLRSEERTGRRLRLGFGRGGPQNGRPFTVNVRRSPSTLSTSGRSDKRKRAGEGVRTRAGRSKRLKPPNRSGRRRRERVRRQWKQTSQGVERWIDRTKKTRIRDSRQEVRVAFVKTRPKQQGLNQRRTEWIPEIVGMTPDFPEGTRPVVTEGPKWRCV